MHITCPRCLTEIEADISDGEQVQCGTCGHKFEARSASPEPKAAPTKKRDPFRVLAASIAILMIVATVPTIIRFRDQIADLVVILGGGTISLIILVATAAFLVAVIVAWVIFPLFVASYLRQIRDSNRELLEIEKSKAK